MAVTKSRGRGGTFRRVDVSGLRITKPGAHETRLNGRWTPGDPIRPRILWGYRPAVELRSWAIQRAEKSGEWTLSATSESIEPFLVQQLPLYFAAPRPKGGFWMWPVKGHVEQFGPNQLRATLGQPEF